MSDQMIFIYIGIHSNSNSNLHLGTRFDLAVGYVPHSYTNTQSFSIYSIHFKTNQQNIKQNVFLNKSVIILEFYINCYYQHLVM